MRFVFSIKIGLLLLIALSAQTPTHAQRPNTPFESSLHALLSLNNTKADSATLLCSEAEKAYLKHYQLFLNQMLHGHFPNHYSDQVKNIADTISKNTQTEIRSWAFLAEIYLQKGIMEYNANKPSDAIFSFFKAYRHWQKSEREHPQLIFNLKLNGIFNLLMGNMPQPYRKWAAWIGFSGNSKMGFDALNQYLHAVSTNKGSQQEAILYLAFSYLKFDIPQYKIEQLIQTHKQTQLTPLAQFTLSQCAFKIRKPQLGQHWFTNHASNTFLPMLYLKGKYQIFTLSGEGANTLLEFISKNSSGQFTADAHRLISWHYLLHGNTSVYFKHQNLIAQLSHYPTWEDKQAKYESTLKDSPNTTLLQARILFDAGAYQTALDTLTAHPKKMQNQAQLIEYHYRLGRCYQMQKNNTKALSHYAETIDLGASDFRYFAPYAALFSAEICREDNPIKSTFYLNEAKRLNNGEHKTDIERKIDLFNQGFNPTANTN